MATWVSIATTMMVMVMKGVSDVCLFHKRTWICHPCNWCQSGRTWFSPLLAWCLERSQFQASFLLFKMFFKIFFPMMVLKEVHT